MKIHNTVRLVLLDADQRILLIKVNIPDLIVPDHPNIFTYWMTVGGGIEEGETIEQAARREAFEETGLTDLTLGPVLWREKRILYRKNQPLPASESWTNQSWILAHTVQTEVSRDHLEPGEEILDYKWWSLDEIRTTEETMTHTHLVTLMPSILSGVYPDPPSVIEPPFHLLQSMYTRFPLKAEDSIPCKTRAQRS